MRSIYVINIDQLIHISVFYVLYLFSQSDFQEEESRRDENLKYNCKCSFLEIYNEQITDLLDPSSTNLLVGVVFHSSDDCQTFFNYFSVLLFFLIAA